MKARLNKRAINGAAYQGTGACYVWDTETANFGLRIYPSGRKSLVVTYRVRGKQRFYTIGRFGEMTVDQARTEALAKLGRRKVADVEHADVVEIQREMAGTPSMFNHVRGLLSSAFNLAEVWGWRQEGTNPCRHVSRFKEESRERFLSEPELSRLGDVLAEAEQSWNVPSHGIAAIRLLLLTGCRSAEILQLRWQEVDFDRRCLNLPDSKTGRKTVRLNSAALQVRAGIERIEGSSFVIPGRYPERPRRTLHGLWLRICQAAKLEKVRIHDLRHTFASFGVNAGLNLPTIGKLLGHVKITTTARYAHLADATCSGRDGRCGTWLDVFFVPR